MAHTRTRRRKAKQLPIRYPNTWGGRRPGAGRPRRSERKLVPHTRRARFHRRCSLHITIRVLDHVPDLRGDVLLPIVEEALEGWKSRDGFRIVHYSVQGNHVHLIVEAPGGRDAVARAMKGIKVAIARRANPIIFSKGRFWADRYHDEVLDTPTKVRNALGCVLNNGRHHRVREAWRRRRDGVDPCSSAEAFDGWSEPIRRIRAGPPPVVPPRTRMLSAGWKRAGGRIAPDFVPGRR
jgi:REP element-mobilizing transposase RayT